MDSRLYESLKNKLVPAPLLCYPDFSKEFTLETDASRQGLGAILYLSIKMIISYIRLPMQAVQYPQPKPITPSLI